MSDDNLNLTPPAKAEKAPKEPKAPKAPKEPKAPKAPKEPKEPKEAGAARPRQWNYGLDAANTIEAVATDKAKVRGEVLAAYEKLTAPMLISDFQALGVDRHQLRVLSRSGLVKVTAPDGTVYPQKL